jgi:hypothetical protein
LTENQIHSLTRHTRGGNWVEGKNNVPVFPHSVALCVPRPSDAGDNRLQRVASLKRQIRRTINRQFRREAKLLVVHSTDDALETQYYLDVLYGEDRGSQCERIESLLKRRPVAVSGHAVAGHKITRESGMSEDGNRDSLRPWAAAPRRNVA